MPKIIVILTLFILAVGALSQSLDNDEVKSNASDTNAVEIANQVIQALGGIENWDNTRYICWNHFGRRFHIWDKWKGNLRFEENDLVALFNLNSRIGRAWQNGTEITDPDSLAKKLEYAYAAWINDSYWMFMPYKLKDPGVTLAYKGEGATLEGDSADILQLTFQNVGLTPQNKYHVYVDKKSHLVLQWDYFEYADNEKPTIQGPWKNWKRYGNILLSDDRGNRNMTDIAVFDKLPEEVFTDPKPINMSQLIKKH